ncbi:MAG: cyclic nucleotide-binding domain-containing protein [Anaerolineae bacterium]
MTSRETEYVDEFARLYLNLPADLLPPVAVDEQPDERVVRACFQAYQDTAPHSPALSRYFYKRYRSLLLARLKSAQLPLAAQAERLKREAALILESWQAGETDTLDYLSQLAPPELRPLFPHLIKTQPADSADLPTETDRRLWQHVVQRTADSTAANTLYRLHMLDQSDIYRSLPAELLLELAQRFCQAHYAPGEAIICQGERNDDVYFLLEGRLEVIITQQEQPLKVGEIKPGEIFGEIAFFTEDPRYATVRAVEASRCFVLTDVELQLLAYQHPIILMQMAGALAKRLADLYKTSRNETV